MVRLILFKPVYEYLSTSRSMLHDELIYPEPSEFRPERYLGKDGQLRALERAEDPAQIAFGFGRRYVLNQCPTASQPTVH